MSEKVLSFARKAHERGAYEEGIETIKREACWESDPLARRVIGLCELGLKRYSAAHTAFNEARRLNTLEIMKDEVNLATALLNKGAYDEAEHIAKHARTLDPSGPSPVICLLSIYNRMQRHKDIERLICEVKAAQPDMLSTPLFEERLAYDTDLVGVSAIMASLLPS